MAGSFELSSDLPHSRSMQVPVVTGGVTEGEVLWVGSVLGFVLATKTFDSLANSIDTNEYTLVTQARQVTANKDGSTVTQGNLVYWDGNTVTESASGNILIGHALEDAAAGDATAEIYFDGFIGNTV